MAVPACEGSGKPSGRALAAVGLSPTGIVHWNLSANDLIDLAVARGEGILSAHGALVTETGDRTGRSPNDKFIVDEEQSSQHINWGEVNVSTSREVYENLKQKVIAYLSSQDSLFVQDLYCGADAEHRLPIRVVSQNAWHAAFARNMFIRPSEDELNSHQYDFIVLHAPHFEANPQVDGVNSKVFVIVNYAEKTVLIGGTRYAGEIKKSIFSVMNYNLPHKSMLPMHCSANTTGENTAIFFGLSGTGKTTLSADPLRQLIGDDEHGWGPNGIFNFEGGCYAKLVNLSEEDEPEIFSTTRRYGSVLENIIIDDKGIPNFFDTALTENTRGSYPIEFIDNRTEDSLGGHPQNVIFLTCDAFGVLPPISRLTPAQAAYHFISGYTAKVAGTEIGVIEPQATFSACFGEPFMPMHPGVYADLLSDKMEQHDSTCWLINTGWSGGGYGVGKRMRIPWTRAMLNAALDGSLNSAEFIVDQRFGFAVPTSCPGVPDEVLIPRNTWADSAAYDAKADELAVMFKANFERYSAGVSEAVNTASPQPSR
ncbi:MAG TPA: phosphoenolpyruvate carboxykinase (ATP) [Candidatus Poseidoniales archaeon]|nr:MAG: phosphoenolpyruvate carboxykinase (ATP) [Euryarchaeota archaeon]HIO95081.1 phosphoenolpyruvate carboxykinase (ATP) [Candidatus Poseidoniales archaeon]